MSIKSRPFLPSFIQPPAKCVIFAGMLSFFGMGVACGDTVNIGILSFDTLIPGAAGSAGLNDFGIGNLTGPLFLLPPDFPVLDLLTFTGVQVTLSDTSGSQGFSLGDLGPGFYTPASLQFLDTSQFSSAIFQATLSRTSFLLSDGTIFLADSGLVTATLAPSAGPFLNPGQDFVVISTTGSISPVGAVPEPRHGVYLLAILGLAVNAIRFKYKRSISS
jgi:hypothetical protein